MEQTLRPQPSEIIALFGGTDALSAAVFEMQELLYAA
jgi:hypothetical protein